ncbi:MULTISPECIES: TRAP transporter substrate-binding protein [unclassified Modicisalibacter]|uniref:TRAP transporter substrate-binding protein n=1 Tax=unclassified Modicisalibacter TaxID=2679913 RepID=UPI001CCECF6C|nr:MULTISPECIES: TRAP transporter substrate-binding protein [unclassified Modicisalibacter]MBZ9559668.1 TRAP transporter substrate-binding protein [Modicisalibacter sp. R2A 31.J]MBZ9577120.1 TRAP transporter substrate-binding protein [Modicisalibacter sp. MOD 31.J]
MPGRLSISPARLVTRSLLALGLAALAAPVYSASMDFSNEYNASSIHAQGDAWFIDRVKDLTDGEVDITLHTGGSLGFRSADHFYAVADNAVQIADSLSGTLGGVDPIFLLSSLPFLADDVESAHRLYNIARPEYAKVFEDNDQILLYASPWPASGIWSKTPVTSMKDLDGLKIRSYDRNGTEALLSAGASPVKLSWADVVPQLATGGIEAVLTSAEAGANGSFWEHLSDFSAINYAVPLNMVHMNRDAFEDLSEANQQAVLQAAKETDAHNWEVVKQRLAQNYAELREHQVAIHDPIPAEFQAGLEKAAEPVVAHWVESAGDRGQRILEQYRDPEAP